MSERESNLSKFLHQCNFEKNNYNYLLTGINGIEKFKLVTEIITTYFNDINKMNLKDPMSHPDVKYISLPIYNKLSKRIGVLSELDRLKFDYGFIDSLDSNKIGREIVIDQIRELTEFLNLSSHFNHKFIIINTCDYLNREASAAILKTLEETNCNSIFFLVATELSKIPDTIISRCQKFDYKNNIKCANYSSYYDYYISSLPGEIVNDENIALSDLSTIEDDLSSLSKKNMPALFYSEKWAQFDKLLLDYLFNLFSLLLKGSYLANENREVYSHLQQKVDIDESKVISILRILLQKKSEFLNLNINKKLFFDDLLIVISKEL